MADNPPDAQQPSIAHEQELANNIFPPPPAYYKAFTSANLARHSALAGPSGTSKSRGAGDAESVGIVASRTEEEESEYARLTAALDPPRSDWVEEEGRWKAFGDVLSIDPQSSLAAQHMPRWFDPKAAPQSILPPILHTFLHTLMSLLDVLTQTAPNPAVLGSSHVGEPYVSHLQYLATTMMVSANSLRGVQAEATLVMLMEKQVETRRAQTEALKQKCRSIASTIQRLKETTGDLQAAQEDGMDLDVESVKAKTPGV